jgi:hypothetical protein
MEGKQENVGNTSVTSDEALSFVNAKLGKYLYQLITSSAKQQKPNTCPSHNNITEAKQRCYSSKESFTVTEVKLQDHLDHTVLRIVQTYEVVLARVAGRNIQKILLVFRWGFDGSTGHSEFKQRFSGDYSNSDLFQTSLVPVQVFTPS